MKALFKSKWFIIALCAVVVVAAAGITFGLNYNKWFGEEEKTVNDSNNTLFWNINRFDYACKSSAYKSSRPKDKDDGYYHILFSNEGRQVTRRTSDPKIVNEIDSRNVMGLIFDEKGIIVGVKDVEDLGYTVAFSNFYVGDASNQSDIVCLSSYKLTGMEEHFGITAKTKIYDMSGGNGEIGIPCNAVNDNDVVTVLKDKKGDVAVVYIVSSNKVGEVYWNVKRMYDSKSKISTRQKSEDGYYHFLLAVNGEQKDFKVKSGDVAATMDSKSVGCFGLHFDNDGIVTSCENAVKVIGGTSLSGYNIMSIKEDTKTFDVENIVTTSADYGKKETVTKARNCRTYNVSGTGAFIGVADDIKVDDRCYILLNSKKEAVYIFITSRALDTLYYNLKVQYDNQTASTKRVPDAAGYYHFDFVADGKQLALRTNEKEIADRVDRYTAACMGLVLDGDIIKSVTSPTAVRGCEGSSVASGHHVMSINGNNFNTECTITSSVNFGKKESLKMASNCKIMVISGNYVDHIGEYSKLMVTDYIHCYKNRYGEVTHIFVKKRTASSPVKTAYCPHCNKEVEWLAYRLGHIQDGGHYMLLQDTGGTATWAVGKTDGSSQVSVVLDLNGHTVSRAGRLYSVQKGSDFTVLDSAGGGKLKVLENCTNDRGLGVYVMQNSTFTLLSGTIDASAAKTGNPAPAIYTVANAAAVNINGGKVIGGTTTGDAGTIYVNDGCVLNINGGEIIGGTAKRGGAILAYSNTVVNMTGGSVSGGQSKYRIDASGAKVDGSGGNIYIGKTAVFNMSGGSVSGGVADASGGNIYINTDAEFNLSNASVTGGVCAANGPNVFMQGDMSVSGLVNVTGGKKSSGVAQDILLLPETKTITVGTLDASSHIGIARAKDGIFAENVPADYSSNFYATSSGRFIGFYTDEKSGNSTLEITTSLEKHTHCLQCGSSYCEEPGHETVKFTAWPYTDKLPTEAGNYFLTDDVVTGQTTIKAGVNICLNGHKINNNGGRRAFVIGGTDAAGTLGITDCSDEQTGKIVSTGEFADNYAATIRVLNGTLNLYKGTIDASGYTVTNSNSSAGVYVGSGAGETTFNMFGGKIIGADKDHASVNGSSVVVGVSGGTTKANFNMSGGIITSGHATKNGGNVCVNACGIINITNGKIMNGVSGGNGPNVYMSGEMSVSGLVKITGGKKSNGDLQDVLLMPEGKEITVGTLETDSSIGIARADLGVFAQNVASDYSANFYSTSEGRAIKYADNKLSLKSTTTGHTHCLQCGKEDCTVTGHETVTFDKKWEETDSLPTAAGNYYLTKDVVTGQTTIKAKVNICLNGHTVKNKDGKRVFVIGSTDTAGTLGITDCSAGETGEIITSGTFADNYAASIRVLNGTLNLYKGTINASSYTVTKESASAGVYVGSGAAETTFNMFGGKIIGADKDHASVSGGSVVVGVKDGSTKATFNMTGGIITSGNATGNGGNIVLNKPAVANIKDGVVTAGVSGKGGANIYIVKGADVTLSGNVKINEGKRDNKSNDIYISNDVKLKLGELGEQADIGIAYSLDNVGDTYVFAENVLSDVSAHFRATSGAGYQITYDGTEHTLTLKHIS